MAAQFDTVFREVEVYDGTGAAPARMDVAIQGDRIGAFGTVAGSATETVDGSALALAPGFIAEARASEEGQEGLRAFLEKRRPAWAPAPGGVKS